MSCFSVNGSHKLHGEVTVHGAKNSVLPLLSAAFLIKGKSVLHNCPKLSDVQVSINILECLGCKCQREGDVIIIDSENACGNTIPEALMREMRSSFVFMGAIVGRCQKAVMSLPGGCELGPRPVDIHIDALKRFGASFEFDSGNIVCNMPNGCIGSEINLKFPSVGATENCMLAAVLGKGTTIIKNAACEPEIVDLAMFLNKAGAKILGAGSSTVIIDGVKMLHSVEHTVMPDRIVAATYLFGVALCKGRILLKNAVPEHISPIISCLSDCGCNIAFDDNNLMLSCHSRLNGFDTISTGPYPGFPTDAGPLLVAMSTVSKGTSVFVENIFDNRFRYVDELKRMGANVKTVGRVAIVNGVDRLHGAQLRADDLRGGAALLIASMAAKGNSILFNTEYVDRGYQNFEDMFNILGADIKRIRE